MLALIASSDDFLLGEGVERALQAARSRFPGTEPEVLDGDDVTPESVAVEVHSPTLFDPQRILVVPDVRGWVDTTAPRGAPPAASADAAPLAKALADGVPEGTALVLGAWCGREPKGPLVEVVRQHGELSWIPVPPPPKPWEDAELSAEQLAVLRSLLARAATTVEIGADAEQLLLERLGFAPRLLVQEVRKLAAAAGPGGRVDVELVRRLVLPKERSTEVVEEALGRRDPGPVIDLLAAADQGVNVRDWSGRQIDPGGVPFAVFNQASRLFERLLYLRRLVADSGWSDQLDPRLTSDRWWYQRRFKPGLAGELEASLREDAPSPILGRGRPPSQWKLGQMFVAASRWGDDVLIRAVGEAGGVEADLRSELRSEAVAAWILRATRGQ